MLQPDGDLRGLCQPVSCTLEASVDLAHLHGSFQSHHLQALIANVCGIGKTRWSGPDKSAVSVCKRGRGFGKKTPLHLSRLLPCEIVFRTSGSVMTSLFSTFGTLSNFLDSPQRLEPPCMLGMLRTAMPSICMLLRYKGLPQHWRKKKNNSKTTTTSCLMFATTAERNVFFLKKH